MRRDIVLAFHRGSRASAPRLLFPIIVSMSLMALGPLLVESKSILRDESLLTLLQKLANMPHLLSYPYLISALGSPNRVTVMPSGTARQAQWLERSTGALRYSFEQEIGPLVKSGHVQNKFDVYLSAGDGIDYPDLVRHFGRPAVSAFDGRYAEKATFDITPYTTLEGRRLYGARTFFEMTLIYLGPAQAAPSEGDCLSALRLRREKAFLQFDVSHGDSAANLLFAYLKGAPDDAEAHLKLGEILSKSGCLNQAISQFRLAYALPWGDERIRKTALERLNSLSITPTVPGPQATPPIATWNKIPIADTESMIDVGF